MVSFCSFVAVFMAVLAPSCESRLRTTQPARAPSSTLVLGGEKHQAPSSQNNDVNHLYRAVVDEPENKNSLPADKMISGLADIKDPSVADIKIEDEMIPDDSSAKGSTRATSLGGGDEIAEDLESSAQEDSASDFFESEELEKDDLDLLERVKEGDASAIESILRDHADKATTSKYSASLLAKAGAAAKDLVEVPEYLCDPENDFAELVEAAGSGDLESVKYVLAICEGSLPVTILTNAVEQARRFVLAERMKRDGLSMHGFLGGLVVRSLQQQMRGEQVWSLLEATLNAKHESKEL